MPKHDSFRSVDVQFNLFKPDCFPNPACSTAAQRAVLVNGEGGELQAGEAGQGARQFGNINVAFNVRF